MIESRSDERNAVALALLRMAVGVLFVCFGQYKVAGPAFVHGGFEGWIHRFLDQSAAYPFMVPVLNGFVLAHATPIAELVAWGELAIGVSLLLGMLSRLASVFGFVYMLALLFASNYPGAKAAPWMVLGASLDHLVLALCFAAFVVGDPDRRLALGLRPRALPGPRTR